MPIPIYDALRAQAAGGRAVLHMPGHKGLPGSALPPELASILPLDSTELPGTGDLYAGEGAILEAEALAAELFGAARTLLSAGGSTLCIQAMLRAALPRGGKLLCGRVLHRAAAEAFCLLDIEPVFLPCDDSAGAYFPGRVTPEALAEALAENPDGESDAAAQAAAPEPEEQPAEQPAAAEMQDALCASTPTESDTHEV